MILKPVNGHLIIEPITHESFIASQKDTYDEIGTVMAIPDVFDELAIEEVPKVGDKVYFDSWLSAKYPKQDSDEFFWLVRFEDVRAVESQ